MKWQAIIAFMLLLAFAPQASAESRVFGLPVEIESATLKQGSIYYVDTRRHGRTQVRDSAACGAPQIGPAYAQYVRMDDGTEYRTLYAQNCAYEILP